MLLLRYPYNLTIRSLCGAEKLTALMIILFLYHAAAGRYVRAPILHASSGSLSKSLSSMLGINDDTKWVCLIRTIAKGRKYIYTYIFTALFFFFFFYKRSL